MIIKADIVSIFRCSIIGLILAFFALTANNVNAQSAYGYHYDTHIRHLNQSITASKYLRAVVSRSKLQWRLENGLPHEYINSVLQSRDGYIWIATRDGVAKFDGQRFTTYTVSNTPVLKNNEIIDLQEDKFGNLWIYSKSTLCRYRNGEFTDISSLFNDKNLIINTIWIGYDGLLYAATNSMVYQYNGYYLTAVSNKAITSEDCYFYSDSPDGSVWASTASGRVYQVVNGVSHLRANNDLLGNSIVNVHCDRNNKVWLTSSNGIFYSNGDQWVKVKCDQTLKKIGSMWGISHLSMEIISDAYDNVWLLDGGMLYRYDRQNLIFRRINKSGEYSRMGVDHTGLFWILSQPNKNSQTISIWNGKGFDSYEIAGGIPDTPAVPVFRDSNNNIWIATMQGLICLMEITSHTYGGENGVPQDINAIAVKDNTIWIGTNQHGLWKLENGKAVAANLGLNNFYSNTGIIVNDNDIWFNNDNRAVIIYNGKTYTNLLNRYKLNLPSPILINALYKGLSGSIFANANGGLLELSSKGTSWIDLSANPNLTRDFSIIAQDHNGRIWVGGIAGFAYIDHKKIIDFGVKDGLPRTPVTSIVEDKYGAMWIGFQDGGLVRYKDGHIKLIDENSGLHSNNISALIFDDFGRLWIGSHSGIYNILLDDLNKYADGKSEAVVCNLLDNTDGYAGGGCISGYLNNACKDNKGDLWFACDQGLVKVDPKPYTKPFTPVIIENIIVDGKSYRPDSMIDAPPGNGSLIIEYTILEYSPRHVKFRYKLENFDTQWVDADTRRVAVYTNLPPGTYRFVVNASVKEQWETIPHAIVIEFQPYYYQTVWFKVVCIVLGFVLIWICYRIQMINAQRNQLERMVELRTAELLDANEELTAAQEELIAQNDELTKLQTELEQQNEALIDAHEEVQAQNEELIATQDELEKQNDELMLLKVSLEEEKRVLALLNAQLASLAVTDGLTGIKNHRAFQEALEQEWKSSSRYHTPLSIMLIDVDNFKHFNDTFGHPAGDRVLKRIAEILRETTRESDIVARYGGEEFVAVLPNSDPGGVRTIAERFRESVEREQWSERSITVSIGTATRDRNTPNGAALIEESDKALYYSKQHGRNCVTFWEDIGIPAKAA